MNEQNYGGIRQRWLVVESELRRESDLKRLEKNIAKAAQKVEKELRQLSRQTFACIPDAQTAAQKLFKKAKYHRLSQIECEQVANKSAQKENQPLYRVRAAFGECAEKLAPIKRAAGRFILATNVLDAEELTADEMLSKYKGQQAVENFFIGQRVCYSLSRGM